MKVGDIVFAPLRDSMWPGRILALGLLVHIKFYKIKENLQVPLSTLLPFIPLNVSLFLKKDSSKMFANAVKIAEGELKKQQRRESQDSTSNLSKRSREKGVKKEPANFRVQSPCKMEDIGEKVSEDSRGEKIVKNEEDCKAEENERSKVDDDKYLPEFDSITSLLLTFSDQELAQLISQPSLHQFVFCQAGTREKVKILSSPQLEVQRLTEWMLSRLLWEKEPKTIQTYQRKLTSIFSSASFTLTSWLSRDVAKLVAMIVAHHEEQLLTWKNSKFIQVLRLFQKKLRQLLCAHQDSFEELVPAVSLVSRFLMQDVNDRCR